MFLVAAAHLSIAQRVIPISGLGGLSGLSGRTILLTTGDQSLGSLGIGQPQVIRLAPQNLRTISIAPQTRPQTVVVRQPAPAPVSISDDDESPKPYSFNYETEGEDGARSSREESGDGSGVVRGSYSYTDPDGVFRTVEYIADQDGYRATVRTNEPGTAKLEGGDPADVTLEVEPPPQAVLEKYSLISAPAPAPAVRVVQPTVRVVSQPQPQLIRVVSQPNFRVATQPQTLRLVRLDSGSLGNRLSTNSGGLVLLNSLRSGRR